MAKKKDAFTANNASVLRIQEPTADNSKQSSDADPGVGGRKRKTSECENQIAEAVAQISLKYEAKFQQLDAAYNLIKTDLETNIYRLKMNKLLAEAFRDMCQDLTPFGHSGIFTNHHPLSSSLLPDSGCSTTPSRPPPVVIQPHLDSDPLTSPAVSNAKEKKLTKNQHPAKNQRIRFSPETKQVLLGLKNLLGCKTIDNVVEWLIETSRPQIDKLIQKNVQSAENLRTMFQ